MVSDPIISAKALHDWKPGKRIVYHQYGRRGAYSLPCIDGIIVSWSIVQALNASPCGNCVVRRAER